MPDPTTILLVRHGLTDWVGRTIAGRQAGVHLNGEGQAQAAGLVGRLGHLPLEAIYSSPLERTMQTAAPLAEHLALTVHPCDAAVEVDFAEWTGSGFDALADVAGWRSWNTWRSFTRVPGGESMPEVQTRIVRAVAQLRERHPGQWVALFSHGDVIRAAVAYFLGVPLDLFLRIEIAPVSVSALRLFDAQPLVLAVNDTGGIRI